MYILTKSKFILKFVRLSIQVSSMLKDVHRYDGAGLGVGQGIVVLVEGEAEVCRHGVQLVVFEVGKCLLRAVMSAIEGVFGVGDAVELVQGAQHTLVEEFPVCHEGKSFHQSGYLWPNHAESGGVVGVFALQAVYFAVVPMVEVGRGA